MALRSVQHGWRKAKFKSTPDNCLPSQSAGPARGIRLLAKQSNILLWRWPGRSLYSCECWTEGTYLTGQARNLIPRERSSWSQPMIGFCPKAEGLSVLANFIQKKDKQTHSSFLTPAKGGRDGGSTERGVFGHQVSPWPHWWASWQEACSSTGLISRDFLFDKS